VLESLPEVAWMLEVVEPGELAAIDLVWIATSGLACPVFGCCLSDFTSLFDSGYFSA
jgi:hypothetical protein